MILILILVIIILLVFFIVRFVIIFLIVLVRVVELVCGNRTFLFVFEDAFRLLLLILN